LKEFFFIFFRREGEAVFFRRWEGCFPEMGRGAKGPKEKYGVNNERAVTGASRVEGGAGRISVFCMFPFVA
jgi:hypothetical protein